MVDKVRVFICAGKGGDGAVHFRRERFIPKGGPDGGNGGRGGSIYFETDPEQNTLQEFAYRQKFLAENGGRGGGNMCSGKAGSDMRVKVPIGTLVNFKNSEDDEVWVRKIDFDKVGISELVAKGGKGGLGNDHFKSSINQTPMEAEEGKPGEEFWVDLELKLLADVGLVGLPNVGKSTILSVLSNARPKIADYEFTTLEPNLGVMKHRDKTVVLADIPGLIEGASMGKGLGGEFLRHVERTRILVHVVAVNDDMAEIDVWKNYQIVRRELEEYGGGLSNKKEIVVLNKTDLINQSKIKKIVSLFAKKKIALLPISCGNMVGIDDLKNKILLFFGSK